MSEHSFWYSTPRKLASLIQAKEYFESGKANNKDKWELTTIDKVGW